MDTFILLSANQMRLQIAERDLAINTCIMYKVKVDVFDTFSKAD